MKISSAPGAGRPGALSRHPSLLVVAVAGGAVVAEGLVPLLQGRGEALRAHLLDEDLEARLLGAQRAELGAGADGRPQAHDVHRPVDGPLVELDDVGGQQRDALGHLQHLVVELLQRERPVGPAEAHRLGARERVAGDHHLHGGPHADEPGVEVHVGHAEAHRRVAHLGVLGHVDEVAAGGELAAAGQAVAVHLGDHRLGQVPDAHPRLGDVAGPVALAARGEVRHVEALVAAAEVVARRRSTVPAPRTIDTRTRGRRRRPAARSIRSPRSGWFRALRFSGRLRVIRRTPGRRVVDEDERVLAGPRSGGPRRCRAMASSPYGRRSLDRLRVHVAGQPVEGLVGYRVDGRVHLVDRRPDLRGQRRRARRGRSRRAWRRCRRGSCASRPRARRANRARRCSRVYGYGALVVRVVAAPHEPVDADRCGGPRRRPGRGWLTPIQQFWWKYSVASRGSTCSSL